MGTQIKKTRCLLLGGGEILNYAAVAAALQGDEYILCADSGFLHCARLGVTPDLLLGDFDSVGSLPPDVPYMEYPAAKDYTDSTLAVRTAVEKGYTDLLLAGMLGGRLDHSLGNLQNLAWCAKNRIAARVTDGVTDVYAVHDASIQLAPRENAYFSILSVSDCCCVSIYGAMYPLLEYPLTNMVPRAVSNEFCGNLVEIVATGGTVLIVIAGKE